MCGWPWSENRFGKVRLEMRIFWRSDFDFRIITRDTRTALRAQSEPAWLRLPELWTLKSKFDFYHQSKIFWDCWCAPGYFRWCPAFILKCWSSFFQLISIDVLLRFLMNLSRWPDRRTVLWSRTWSRTMIARTAIDWTRWLITRLMIIWSKIFIKINIYIYFIIFGLTGGWTGSVSRIRNCGPDQRQRLSTRWSADRLLISWLQEILRFSFRGGHDQKTVKGMPFVSW